ncbi:MAG: tetratricopeptide repeat protein [Candidatus Marinimicrobia bacterium]|nr:tetratricopeptide repeat protein [Candidatus Neomarinimicrobiota bacterium]
MKSRSEFRKGIPLLCLGFILLFSACSKKDISILSTEKMPITTSSKAALADYNQGLNYADKLQRTQADTHFRNAVEKDPTFATAWLNLALVAPGPNQFMAYLDSALKYAASASEGEQLVIQSVEYGFLGNTTKQGETFEAAVILFPSDERLHTLHGNYYFGLQQYQLAIKSYERAVLITPSMAAPYNMLGYAQRSLGNYGEAEKAFKMYIKLNPKNPNAFDSYAELLLEMGRPTESNEFYRKALVLDSTFTASYIGIATNYNFLGEFDKAREELQELKRIAQNYTILRQALFAQAVSYLSEGDFETALETMNEAMEIAIANEDVANISNDLTLIGNGYLELGHPETALLYYKSSIKVIYESELQPAIIENATTNYKYNVSRAYAAQGKFKKARDMAESYNKLAAVNMNPVQIKQGHQLNGIVALSENKYEEAINELGLANQLNPYNLYRIGQAYFGLGQDDQGTLFMQRAEELNALNSFDQSIVLSKTRKKQAS